jgi:hypothetical protein
MQTVAIVTCTLIKMTLVMAWMHVEMEGGGGVRSIESNQKNRILLQFMGLSLFGLS